MTGIVYLARCVAILAVFCGTLFADSVEPLKVIYLSPDPDDQRAGYYEDVIRMALDRSNVPYSMQGIYAKMTHRRKIQSVVTGELSVMWATSRPEVDALLEPIKIPICSGLIGYRVLMIRKDLQPVLAEVKTLDELKSFRIGQGVGWGDTAILENAGFVVDTAPYDSLFKMLDVGRFDLFPRGIHEAQMELNIHKKRLPSLMIDSHIGLHYPLIRFLYVKKGNEPLREALTLGLERMQADGSFNEFLENHPFMKPIMEQSGPKDRVWFELDNPFVNPDDLKNARKYFDQKLLSRIR